MRGESEVIEAMKQALEALDFAFEKDLTYLSDHAMIARQDVVRSRLAITALRAAIAEASMQRLTDVQQEMDCYGDGNVYRGQRSADSQTQTILVPPLREWVGLTDEDILDVYTNTDSMQYMPFSRAIEAKLKEKNDDK